jgi:outer membrane protein
MKIGPGLLSFLLFLQLCSYGQTGSSSGQESLSLLQALQVAEKNYPLLKSKSFEIDAARKGIQLSKNSLVPSLDISYQANLATANNITGMFYPVGVIPMTGPVFSENNYSPAFGSAASLLLNWQPFTFGRRAASTDISNKELSVTIADADNELFRHKINVASAYLDQLLSAELVGLYEENVVRTQFNLKQSRVLAITGLRPGVDTALFLAELSKARIDLLTAKKNLQTQQIMFSALLVLQGFQRLSDSAYFAKLPMPVPTSSTALPLHPMLKFSQSQLDLSKSKETLLKNSWLPVVNVWGTGMARGSGVYPDGSIKAADGWGFSKYNYGLGFQLAFPILKHAEIRIQLEQQNFITKSKEEMLNQVALELAKQEAVSNANLETGLEVAKETAIEAQSAEYAFRALQIRYSTGLVNFADLIQAQYSLVKSQTDLRKAYWEAWKALLYKAAVSGDLNLFLNESK